MLAKHLEDAIWHDHLRHALPRNANYLIAHITDDTLLLHRACELEFQ